MNVHLRTPGPGHRDAFLEATGRSTTLHHPWVFPPLSPAAYADYLRRCRQPNFEGHLVIADDGSLVGVINFTEIVMGAFRSSYVGYYAFSPHAGKGLMAAGLNLALRRAFGALDLHRVEANVQPTNAPSLALVRAVGFRLEGYSPRFLHINGAWRDHERWAMTAEDFAERSRSSPPPPPAPPASQDS